ncbi:LysR substrate-binding domain-containing protein [Acuticoccus kandeliae]|uniref:LysR substrate-binding domain-containing protein n=1 Tax=Acuticoccus kandeliae TaxID=2073160 RepID=UPI000D3E22CF|nr:LysR substrate-binding domain-containing protein [Acuticoccus kandeliae]
MNVRHVEAFRAVMLTGSVTRGAEVLNISQPAMSQLIRAMEAACGLTLFERHGNRLSPTREAEILFGEVERLYVSVESIGRVASDLRAQRWGNLNIAAFPAMANRFLPKIVARFCSDRPNVQVSFESRRSRTLVDWIAANQADIGIGLLQGDRSGVETVRLSNLRAVCAVPRDHPLAAREVIHAADVADLPFISLGNEDRARQEIDRTFEREGVKRRLQIETAQSVSAVTLVGYGYGVSVVDPFCVFEYDPSEIAVRTFEPRIEFTLALLFPAGRRRQALTDAFLEMLTENVDEVVRAGPRPRGGDSGGPARTMMSG